MQKQPIDLNVLLNKRTPPYELDVEALVRDGLPMPEGIIIVYQELSELLRAARDHVQLARARGVNDRRFEAAVMALDGLQVDEERDDIVMFGHGHVALEKLSQAGEPPGPMTPS